MLPADFWLMCEGYMEHRNQEHEVLRNIIYGAARYNAANTAFSKKQAKSISNYKFPWEKGGSTDPKDRVLSYDKVKGMFNMISKPKDDAE